MRTDFEFLTTEIDGHILTVTINRPEVMNALHPPAHAEFDEVWNEFDKDEDLWVGIVTGAGDRAFSAGNDLKFQAQAGGKMDINIASSGFAGLTSRFNLTKPLIAAVNGVSMGGGFEIALACDLIVASTNAKFALPEPKVGLAALAGGMQRLPRQIGMKNALGMMLTGRHVSAEEGMKLGFVNEVVEPDNLIEAAKNWAKQIEQCSPMSIRATKQVAYENFNEPDLEKSMKAKYSAVGELFGSEDFIEGPVAFAEKRLPNWKGKIRSNKMFDLTGKNAIITGSSKGIGKSIAMAMAKQGANVVISSRKVDVCEATAEEINSLEDEGAGKAIVIPCNISDKTALEMLVEETRSQLGQIDILVCNAATNPYFGSIKDITDDAFEKIMNNNIKSNHNLCQMVIPEMMERKDGSIIIVSSIGGLNASPVIGAYNISKAADIMLVKNYALEFGQYNIRTNAIAPGLFKTDFAKALWENPEILKQSTATCPMKRIGEPDEIGGAAVFLASQAGSFVNGHTLVIDGGTVV